MTDLKLIQPLNLLKRSAHKRLLLVKVGGSWLPNTPDYKMISTHRIISAREASSYKSGCRALKKRLALKSASVTKGEIRFQIGVKTMSRNMMMI